MIDHKPTQAVPPPDLSPGSQVAELQRTFEEARGLIELAIPVWATQLAILVAFIAAPNATFPFWPAVVFVVGSDILILAFALPAMARFDRATLLAAAWDPWPDFESELRHAVKLAPPAALPSGSWFPIAWFGSIEGPVAGGHKPRSRFQQVASSLAIRQVFVFSGMAAYFLIYGWFILSRCCRFL